MMYNRFKQSAQMMISQGCILAIQGQPSAKPFKRGTPSCCGSKIITGLGCGRDYNIKPYGFGYGSYKNLKMKSQLFQDGIVLSKMII